MHHHHVFDAAFWDRKYEAHQGPWDGEPNAFLAERAAGLSPGVALDVGCGEGADALWLAARGWRVTAIELSTVALARARAADADGRVAWLEADMRTWAPPADAYDLVAAHYLHVAPEDRAGLFGRLACAVRPGGSFLFVAHHPSDLATTLGRPPIPDLYFHAKDVAAALAPGTWAVELGGTRPHEVTDRAGNRLTIQDMVLHARRLA